MPNIHVDEPEMERWADKLYLEEENQPERTGVHVSDIINCLRQPVLTRIYLPEHSLQSLLLFKMGRAFENALFKYLLPDSTREVEVKEAGIEGHIDFGMDNDLDYETKVTWKYPKDDPWDLFDGYYYYVLEQAGTYAIMRRRRACRIAIYHVQPPPPTLVIYLVEWTAREQGDLWNIMLKRRDYLLEGFQGKRMPSKTVHKELCRSCPVKAECDQIGD